MAKKILSIEIGLQETKVCELTVSVGTHKVIRSITFPTPPNTVEDGYIRDKATFSNELRSILKNEKFGTTHVIFSIVSTKIYTKEIILPQVAQSKMKEIIDTNIKDYLPFQVEDYVINYSLVEKIKNKSEKKIRVMLIAMPENMVKNYYSLAEMTGLEVVSLDYNGNSIYQILKEVSEKGTNAYIQMNEQSTMVTILKEHTLVLQRTISYGTNELVQAVLERNSGMITEEREAYRLLSEENFITADLTKEQEEAAATVEEDVNIVHTQEAVSEAVSYLVSSVGRVIDYYINQGGSTLQNIYLLGHGSRIKGIQEYIQRELGIYPQTFEQLKGYRGGKLAVSYLENPSAFVSCLGAILHPIGFQPKDILSKKVTRSNVIETCIMITLCLGGAVMIYLAGSSEYRDKKLELEHAKTVLARLPVGDETEDRFQEVLGQLEQMEGLDQSTRKNAEQLYELMEVFEKNFVTITEVSSMQVTNEAISMNITMPSKKSAARMILQLQGLTDYFEEVKISGVTETEEDGISRVTFSISCIFVQSQTKEGEN